MCKSDQKYAYKNSFLFELFHSNCSLEALSGAQRNPKGTHWAVGQVFRSPVHGKWCIMRGKLRGTSSSGLTLMMEVGIQPLVSLSAVSGLEESMATHYSCSKRQSQTLVISRLVCPSNAVEHDLINWCKLHHQMFSL